MHRLVSGKILSGCCTTYSTLCYASPGKTTVIPCLAVAGAQGESQVVIPGAPVQVVIPGAPVQVVIPGAPVQMVPDSGHFFQGRDRVVDRS